MIFPKLIELPDGNSIRSDQVTSVAYGEFDSVFDDDDGLTHFVNIACGAQVIVIPKKGEKEAKEYCQRVTRMVNEALSSMEAMIGYIPKAN